MPPILSPQFIITTAGPWALVISALIVFAESGLLVGFFLPGDSLVFLLGMVSAATTLPDSPLASTPLWLICLVVVTCAFIGDQVGYELGAKGGETRLMRSWSRGKNAARLDRARRFFEHYGSKAIVLARFVPILRTFVPFAIGLTHYRHRKFVAANLLGSVLWGVTVPVMGYLLGHIPFVADHVDALCLAIVFVSVLPLIIKGCATGFAHRSAPPAVNAK